MTPAASTPPQNPAHPGRTAGFRLAVVVAAAVFSAVFPGTHGRILAAAGGACCGGAGIYLTRVLGNALSGLPAGAVWRAAWREAVPGAGACPAASGGWRGVRAAARLMPPAAGRRWLAEADSFLAEAPPGMRRGAIGSYLAGAPQVIIMTWAAALARQARLARRRRAARQ